MQDTNTIRNQPGLTALVAMIATVDAAHERLVSSTRLVDALLDVRGEVEPHVVPAVDRALAACAHRHIVPIDEALELVAAVTAGQALQADPV